MNLAPAEPVFSLDLGHLRSPRFGAQQIAAVGQPQGLRRFVGDQSNGLLRYICEGFPDTLSPEQLPIVFFGPPSTGKTSLALALLSAALDSSGTDAEESDRSASNCFLPATDFDRRFRQALETKSVAQFRQRLLQGPGLILDNLHQLAGKIATQLELIHLLDHAQEIGFPILMTLDQAPAKSSDLIAQLQSRISAGLSIPFEPPGPNARRTILTELAYHHQLQLTKDAIAILAQQLPVTVPKLAQTVIQLKALLDRAGLDPEQSIDQHRLVELLRSSDQDTAHDSELIIAKVAQRYHLRPKDLVGASRKQSIVLARGIAVYLHRKLLGASFQNIGCCFGNRDHSTVLHAYGKVKQLMESDQLDSAATRQAVHELEQRLSDQMAGRIQWKGLLKTC